MHTSKLPAAVVLTLGLAACSSGSESDGASDDVVGMEYVQEGTAETEGYANDPDTAYEPLVVDLDTEHDFGDGFTIRIDGLERRVAEDGYNATTGEEGDLPYLAWTVHITNGTDQNLHTGSVTSSCSVGDPLMESEAPVYGSSVNPPDVLAPGQSGAWEQDCFAGEGDEYLQWTIRFFDQEFAELYPELTFAGQV
ncbi:hypothetical protein NE857_18990 [Nocardiopsis exhalans]|uniref:DUF4352 domain-containing protein n=1 Tax=Nocardiopsis exhalans TaxID=163604 RepID=A0ABY5D0J2_9ACTN|nr:hypothetical protein [Nocardiopsis exhalans]USY17430.1 hypothetical protein NE857_18990 [Nocardiopsis exhalans]